MKNLIAISGKIGSGKDTIFTIIQLLVTNKIRTARGAAPLTWEVFTDPKNKSVSNHREWDESGFLNKKFAYKLKQFASTMLAIPTLDLELEEVKDRVLGPEWDREIWYRNNGDDTYKRVGYVNHDTGLFTKKIEPTTVRQFLQDLGTNAVRNNVHNNAWVNALFADYKANRPCNRDQSETCVESPNCSDWAFSQVAQPEGVECNRRYPKWIITDCRFPNEAEAIEERGGLLIRVKRDVKKTSQQWQELYPDIKVLDPDGWDRKNYQFSWHEELITFPEYHIRRRHSTCRATRGNTTDLPHPSETALDNYKFKYTIDNSGTIEELIEQVKIILEKEKIL